MNEQQTSENRLLIDQSPSPPRARSLPSPFITAVDFHLCRRPPSTSVPPIALTLSPLSTSKMSPTHRRPRLPPRPPTSTSTSPSPSPTTTSSPRASAAAILSRYRRLLSWTPNPLTAFLLLLTIRLSGAFLTPIADCDETYNYWEPLHALLHSSALQTWEYSPTFALRSYAFLFPFAVPARLGAALAVLISAAPKPAEFYAVRVALALASTGAELALYDATALRFGGVASRTLLLFLASLPGLYRASTEFLPSSISMILATLATSFHIMGHFTPAVVAVAVSGVVSWPFAALLGVPLFLHVVGRRGVTPTLKLVLLAGCGLTAALFVTDSYFYGKPTLAPLNIIRYNIFPPAGAGPQLYGTEPFSFYVTNLILNLTFLPALALLLPFLFPFLTLKKGVERIIYLSPPYLWLAVFLCQPHKEERFLAPIYPSLALAAAVAVADIAHILCHTSPLPRRFRTLRALAAATLPPAIALLAIAAGSSRIALTTTAFRAPFAVFRQFVAYPHAPGATNLCMGDHWYRFPSNFFLPDTTTLRFVPSSFKGLLPAPFTSFSTAAPWLNQFNTPHSEQYTDLAECHYLATFRPGGEDDLPGKWLALFSEEMLDLERSPSGYRSFWISGRENMLVYGRFEIRRNLELLPMTD